jgi:thiol-disulfide isomerase/thioredoxin
MQTRLLAAAAAAAAFLMPAGCGASEPAANRAGAPPAASAPAKAPQPPATPQQTPTAGASVRYTGLDGKAFTVDELPGSVKVVNYWATWCAPCIKEIPSFNALHAKYGTQGVTIVGISVDEEGKQVVEPFLKTPKGKMNYKVALAKLEDLKAVDVTEAIPVTLVYDKSGKLVKRFDGYADEKALEAAINDAMKAAEG